MFNRKGLARLGDLFGFEASEFTNRTGATLTTGQIAMLDLAGTQAETTSITVGAASSAFANVGPVTQQGHDDGFPIVVALEDIADNATGRFCLQGIVDVSTLADDASTTDVDQGDPVSCLVSESATSIQAAAVTAHRNLGIALEDAAATSGPTLRRMLWWGGDPGKGMTRDA